MILFSNLGIPEQARPLAKLINDYDPNLTLERLPDGHPYLMDNPDKPYAVVHRPLGLPEYVYTAYPEHLLDHRVFADILAGSAREHGFDLEKFDPVGAAAMLLEGRKRADEWEENNARASWELNRKRETGPRSF